MLQIDFVFLYIHQGRYRCVNSQHINVYVLFSETLFQYHPTQTYHVLIDRKDQTEILNNCITFLPRRPRSFVLISLRQTQQVSLYSVCATTSKAPPSALPGPRKIDHGPFHNAWHVWKGLPPPILKFFVQIKPQNRQDIGRVHEFHTICRRLLRDGLDVKVVLAQRCELWRFVRKMVSKYLSEGIHDFHKFCPRELCGFGCEAEIDVVLEAFEALAKSSWIALVISTSNSEACIQSLTRAEFSFTMLVNL